MTPEQTKMLELLDETVNYYKANPRSVNRGSCYYYAADGRMCAIGRKLINPKAVQKSFKSSLDCTVGNIKNLNKKLVKDCRGLPLSFWRALQILHDDPEYWESNIRGNRLTDIGLCVYKNMKERIVNNQYT